jgi:microcystin-dependent protein
LFASIGTTYGAGDGSTTFNIPDLRGRTVIGLDNMGGTNAGVITGGWGSTLGGKYGEEKHTLTIAEMPSHTHTMSSSGGSPGPAGMPNGVWPNGSIITTVTTDARGGSGAHNVIQPSIALEYIIKAQ